ncbi:hypothetical protein AAF712_003613 [Marasmius tenuissimus]|uniref:Alpha/beta hydrolase fold-3 domain-containing protein n=1 Tax=Marasmius tenuissimus TaxID=585030 RepID=A0ABR3A8F9_9AGAR
MSTNGVATPPPALLKLPWKNQQPIKGLYVLGRVLSLLLLVPSWSLYYLLAKKPRASWTVGQSVAVCALRWIVPLNAECGLSPDSVSKVNPPSEFKESSLIWMEPANEKLVRGLAKDERVRPVKVPGYVWPRGKGLDDDDAQEGFVALFIHGGGYMMGNGTENFGELDIARKLLNKNPSIKRLLSVEYRLVGDECHPAQLLDGLAAYSYLLRTAKVNPSRIILIGACSGGHLSMMLLRYLYEEKVLPLPAALMLFAPVLDMVTDFEIVQGLSTHRESASIDWLTTSHYANVRFLGHNSPDLLKSPAIASNRAPSGSYTGYPPTFVSIGDADLLLAEIEQLVKTMQDDRVDVVLDIQKDGVHHFLSIPFMPTDGAREDAIKKAVKWVGSLEKRVAS